MTPPRCWMPQKLTRRPDSLEDVKVPEPLIVAWQGHELRVRHDDPHLGPYTPRDAVIRSAIELASDVEGLRLALLTTVGDRYRVGVSDDGSVVGLWRQARDETPPFAGRASGRRTVAQVRS
jgi:hypothetical protein